MPGCTCNGKDAFGLVTMKAAEDPTLRQGDVVATDQGFVAYSGRGSSGKNGKRTAEFTPIDGTSGTAGEWRRQLSQTKIMPNPPVPAIASAAAADAGGRQVQLER